MSQQQVSTWRVGPWAMVWACVLLICVSPGQADPPQPDPETAALIDDLVGDDLPAQAAALAALELRDLDASSIPPLKAAAEADNLRGQRAAIKLLVRLAKPDTDLGKAAKNALKELSQSNKPQVVAAATQALRALEPGSDPPPADVIPGQGLRLPGNRAVFQARNFESVITTTINGERQIQVRSQDRRIEIKDQDGKSIEIKVTETAGGKETIYSAKDLDDLKQKHPDIVPLFEKYTKPAAGLPPGKAGLMPGLPPGFNIPAAVGSAKEVHQQIEEALTRLTKVKAGLEAMDQETFNKEKVKALLDELDAANKELFAAQAKLGVR